MPTSTFPLHSLLKQTLIDLLFRSPFIFPFSRPSPTTHSTTLPLPPTATKYPSPSFPIVKRVISNYLPGYGLHSGRFILKHPSPTPSPPAPTTATRNGTSTSTSNGIGNVISDLHLDLRKITSKEVKDKTLFYGLVALYGSIAVVMVVCLLYRYYGSGCRSRNSRRGIRDIELGIFEGQGVEMSSLLTSTSFATQSSSREWERQPVYGSGSSSGSSSSSSSIANLSSTSKSQSRTGTGTENTSRDSLTLLPVSVLSWDGTPSACYETRSLWSWSRDGLVDGDERDSIRRDSMQSATSGDLEFTVEEVAGGFE